MGKYAASGYTNNIMRIGGMANAAMPPIYIYLVNGWSAFELAVDYFDFFLDGGEVVLDALDAALHLPHHRVARFTLGCKEAEIILIGLELVALDLERAEYAFALAVELVLVGAHILYHILESAYRTASLTVACIEGVA